MRSLVLTALLSLLAVSASAQPVPPGQSPGGAINFPVYMTNTDSVGFSDASIALITVPGTSTAQATFGSNGQLLTGTLLQTRLNLVTTCSATTGVTLPAVQYYLAVTILNRSGGACLVWPTLGTTVETAIGTDGANNAPATQASNTDVTYRPVPTAAGSVKWLQ